MTDSSSKLLQIQGKMVPGKKAPKKSKTRAKKKKSNNYSAPVLKWGYPQFSSILPSGKHTKNYGKSPFSMGKSTISITIFNSFLYVYQRVMGFPMWIIQLLGYPHDYGHRGHREVPDLRRTCALRQVRSTRMFRRLQDAKVSFPGMRWVLHWVIYIYIYIYI